MLVRVPDTEAFAARRGSAPPRTGLPIRPLGTGSERLAADVEGRLTGEFGRPIRRLPTRCPARAGRSDGLLLKTASSFRRAPEQFVLLFNWLLCKQAPLFDK